MKKKIRVIQGPNLNLLGTRQPELYGSQSLQEIHRALTEKFSHQAEFLFFQSNHEGALIDAIHDCKSMDGIVINPGAYTHTSYAIRDAIEGIGVPAVEVHVTQLYARESFRHISLIAPVCVGQISGFGTAGYELAIRGLLQLIERR
ncbi:MAG: type II 3-dehydroquinate dehydratase [Myxococcaceae bacterium]|nr:type II 3-dehydroquinate dehydratase [Myxococcaceae bacterium]MBH2005993.1 type II 3-dehydroquinate dehydratase [Myxococcaceae bacterium]